MVEEYFGDGTHFGCQIEYLREEQPLGTGGCLALLPSAPSAPVLVMNGDLVTQADVGRMLEFHVAERFAATMGLRPHIIEIPFGVASVNGPDLVGIREKPTERMLVNAGIYVLSPEVVQMVTPDCDFPITDLFRRCIDTGLRVGGHIVEDDWLDVGRPEELFRANGRL
jgi:NDP-sugar pyrophosphorylase family protein